MTTKIDEFFLNCDICATHRDRQQKEPLLVSSHPNRPWQRVGADLFHAASRKSLHLFGGLLFMISLDLPFVDREFRSFMKRYGCMQPCGIFVASPLGKRRRVGLQ